MDNSWFYQYMQTPSGIGDWTNGQLQNGLAIGNLGLNAAQAGLSFYNNRKALQLQKQALALQKANQAYTQQVTQNKALAGANILSGMGRGIEGFDGLANYNAVKSAYAPNTGA